MIIGEVDSNEGRIRLNVKGPRGRGREIEAVIDTSYSGCLTLPPALIATLNLTLNLKWRSVDRGVLADGSQCLFDVFEASVLWNGRARRILVDEAATDPLVGMGLSWGYELRMQVCSRAVVTIQQLAKGHRD